MASSWGLSLHASEEKVTGDSPRKESRMEPVGIFFAALVLAFVVEALLEYVFGIWWKPMSDSVRPRVLMAVGLVIGVGLCLAYKVDLLAELGLKAGYVGQVLTGAIVGRGSEYLHAFYKKIKP